MENHSKIKGLFPGSASFVSAKYLFNNTLIFLMSHIRVRLKETAQKKKSVSELVPRQFYISFQTGCNDYTQKFYMACGIYGFSLFSFGLPNSSLIVLFINNIRFHKQLSVANMFCIPRQKDDQKQSCKRQMWSKISRVFFNIYITAWHTGDLTSRFLSNTACVIYNMYFHSCFVWAVSDYA